MTHRRIYWQFTVGSAQQKKIKYNIKSHAQGGEEKIHLLFMRPTPLIRLWWLVWLAWNLNKGVHVYVHTHLQVWDIGEIGGKRNIPNRLIAFHSHLQPHFIKTSLCISWMFSFLHKGKTRGKKYTLFSHLQCIYIWLNNLPSVACCLFGHAWGRTAFQKVALEWYLALYLLLFGKIVAYDIVKLYHRYTVFYMALGCLKGCKL